MRNRCYVHTLDVQREWLSKETWGNMSRLTSIRRLGCVSHAQIAGRSSRDMTTFPGIRKRHMVWKLRCSVNETLRLQNSKMTADCDYGCLC